MRIPWKYLGLAGVAGVAATGAVVARRRRAQREDIPPDELRARLHQRFEGVRARDSETPAEHQHRR
ncbi:MAG TPA: hypothetical protein VF587_00495 [Solirubrobacteraceae bacterium]|jgi:hypothetical protein